MVDRAFADARLAELYDKLYPCVQSRDLEFYMPMMMAAEAVLDVGCGTGAMLQHARQAGHAGRLCGLDPAAAMLAQARKRTDVEWICGDLASVNWAAEFDLVVMTGHAFQVLVEDSDLRASLAAVRRILKRGGRFAFETRNPAARGWENWRPDSAVEITDAQGVMVRVTRRVEAPFDGRSLSFAETFTCQSWDRPQVSRSTLRFLSADAVRSFLDEAGLVIEKQFGNWDRQPLTDASPEIITIAQTSPQP
jgi:ubiquinone/menaquinone biosynthesis C-methylase UbiE